MTVSLAAEPLPLREDADGVLRVGATRVSLDTVAHAFDEGLTAEEIVQRYPSLDLADVYGTIAYVLRHRDEVERYLMTRRERARAARAEIEAHGPSAELRRRLIARLR